MNSTSAPAFPVTKEFLELTFNQEVEQFSVTNGNIPGDNLFSEIHCVEVLFRGEDNAKHFILKCYATTPAAREYLDRGRLFEKELFLYETFFPMLNNFANGRSMEDHEYKDLSLSIAPFHGGNVPGLESMKYKDSLWSKESFLLMTDLRRGGFQMRNRISGLDLPHGILLMREVAKMHASTWAYKKVNGVDRLTLQYSNFLDTTHGVTLRSEKQQAVGSKLSDIALQSVKSTIGENHPAYVGFKKLLDIGQSEIRKWFTAPEGIDDDLVESNFRVKPGKDETFVKEPWLVGVQGGCWINNMLFQYNSDQQPDKVALIDFQIFNEACPTLALVYILFGNFRAVTRKAHKKELVQVYYDAFVEHCDSLQVGLLPGFTLEAVQKRLKRAQYFGLIVAMSLLTVVLKSDEDTATLEGIRGQGMDDVFMATIDGSEKNREYRDELSAIVMDMYEDGVL